jgi:hypothetical protein
MNDTAPATTPAQPEDPAARTTRFEELYAGLDQIHSHLSDEEKSQMDGLLSLSDNPNEAKARMVNQAYLQSTVPDADPELMANNWDAVKKTYAKQVLGVDKPDITDTELYQGIGARVAKQKDERTMMAGVVKQMAESALAGDSPNGWLGAYQQVAKGIESAPGFDPANRDRYRAMAMSAYNEAASMRQNLEPAARTVLGLLQQDKKQTQDGDLKDFYAQQRDEAGNPQEALDAIKAVPADQRPLLYSMIAKLGSAQGQKEGEAQSFGQNAQKAIGNMLTDLYRDNRAAFDNAGVVHAQTLAKNAENLGVIGDPQPGESMLDFVNRANPGARGIVDFVGDVVKGNGTPTARKLTAEEQAQLKSEVSDLADTADITRSLRDLQRGTVDPIVGSNFFTKKVLYPAVGMAGLVGESMVPYAGIPLLINSTIGQSVDAYSRKGLPPEQAQQLGLVAGAIQAPMVAISGKMVAGSLPFLKNLISEPVAQTAAAITARGATLFAVEAGTMNVLAAAQELTPSTVQWMASKLSADYPKVDWAAELKDFGSRRMDTFWAMLPMVAVGTGVATFGDAAYGRRYLSNMKLLRAAGFDEAMAKRIIEAPSLEAKQQIVRELWNELDKGPPAEPVAADLADEEATTGREGEAQHHAEARPEISDREEHLAALDEEMRQGYEEAGPREDGPVTTRLEDGSYEVKDAEGNVIDITTSPEVALELMREHEKSVSTSLGEQVQDMIDFIAQTHEEGSSIELTNQRKTLREKIDAGDITVEEARHAIEVAVGLRQLKEGAQPEDAQIFGENVSHYDARTRYFSDVSLIHDGANPLTVVEEHAEGYLKRRLANGDIDESELNDWRDQVEGPGAGDRSRRGLTEWFSNMAKAYITGHADSQAIPPSVRGFLKQLGQYFASVLETAARLMKLEREGKLPDGFQRHLARATGLDENWLMERAQAEERGEAIGKPLELGDWIRGKLPHPKAAAAKGESLAGELRDLFEGMAEKRNVAARMERPGKPGRKAYTMTSYAKAQAFFAKEADSGTLDSIAEAAREAGFNDILTPADLLDAVDRSLRGLPVYAHPIDRGQVERTFGLGDKGQTDMFAGGETGGDQLFNLQGEEGKDYTGIVDKQAAEREAKAKAARDQTEMTFSLAQLKSPEFKEWKGKAVLVRAGKPYEFKTGKPVVVEAFHGTTHDFSVIDRERGNIENDFGRGFYASTNARNVEANYAGEGPDLTGRIERRSENLENDLRDLDVAEVADKYGLTGEEAALVKSEPKWNTPEREQKAEILKNLARKELTGHGGATMKVFVRLENPLVLGGKGEGYWDMSYDEDTGMETGKLAEFASALHSVASRYDDADPSEALQDFIDGGKPSEIIARLREHEGMSMATDPDTGDIATSQIIAEALQRMGYDGIIDRTVNEKFGSQRRMGKQMEGMDENTVHVISFDASSVKSATGNRGSFDRSNPDITYNLGTKEALDEVQRVFAPQSRGGRSAETAGVLREHGAELAQRTDRAAAYLEDARKHMDAMPSSARWDFVHAVETGAEITDPALKAIADKFRRILDYKRDEVRALGPGELDHFIRDYFPHVWENPSEAAAIIKKASIEGGKAFLKAREIPTTKEGMELGLKPKSDNPVDLVLMKVREMNKFILAQNVIKDLEGRGIAQRVPMGAEAPEGYVPINDKISLYKEKAPLNPQPGALGLEGVDMASDGYRVMGQYWAPQEVAQVVNNYLSPGRRGSKLFEAYLSLANSLNQFQLGLSAFHLGFTSLDAATSKFALGVEHLVDGNLVAAGKAIAGTPVAPVMNAVLGDKVLKEWMKPGSQGAEIAGIVDALKAAGGRAQMDNFYQTTVTRKMLEAFRQGNVVAGVLRAPFAGIELAAKPIMEYIVPRQKLGVFAEMARREMANLKPGASRDEVRAAMAKAWDSVDNRLGQMVYDNLFWNKAAKDLSMASVRSLGWNLGTLRELGGGALDALAAGKTLASGQKPEFTHRMAYLVAMPMLTGLMGAITQYMLTGKGPEELKDYFFPKTGELDPQGREVRLTLPSYMKDVAHYLHDPVGTLTGKVHPAIALATDMLNNKDFFGRPIRNSDDPVVKQVLDEAQHVAEQFEPMGIANALKAHRAQTTTGEQAAAFVGVVKAPQWLSMSPAEQLAQKLVASRMGPGTTAPDQDKLDAKSRLLSQLRNGTQEQRQQAAQQLDQMVQSGKLTKREAHNLAVNASKVYLVNAVQHLDASDAMRVYKAATKAEREVLHDAIGAKVVRSALPPADKISLMTSLEGLSKP